MNNIEIKKGHDIKISGIPKKDIELGIRPKKVSLSPTDFKGIKPKLLIKKGDSVKIGSPLFFDKLNPQVKWGSPGGGVIGEIKFGPKRVLEKIEIDLDGKEEVISKKKRSIEEIRMMKKTDVMNMILDSNLFHLIRQRPFNRVANPLDSPRDIFISCVNSSPLTPDLDFILKENITEFQSGLDILGKITEGDVFIGVSPSSYLINLENVHCFTVNGPHPSGNVGIQIHHIKPLKPKDIIWTVSAQDVVTLGKLFLEGIYDPRVVITVGGPGVKNPKYLTTRVGSSIKLLLKNQLSDVPIRILSGDVLTGSQKSETVFLGFYDSSITVILDKVNREFLGMLNPGSSKSRYSLFSAFLKFGNINFPFSTANNGSHRAIVPLNTWENVLPMDILPNELYRAILAEDIDEMEQLGLWECDAEDFALCSFVCPSKTDVGSVIRRGLDMLELEG